MGWWVQMMRLKATLGAFVFVVATFVMQASAVAGPQWCEEDPEFLVNGAVMDVTTLFPYTYASTVNGSVNFDLQVPSNAFAVVLSLPGTVPVTAQVRRTLPAYYGLLSVPVILTVSMDSSASFTTTTKVTGTAAWLLTTFYGTSTYPTKVKFSMYGL